MISLVGHLILFYLDFSRHLDNIWLKLVKKKFLKLKLKKGIWKFIMSGHECLLEKNSIICE